jgi:transcription antitermination factor NusG
MALDWYFLRVQVGREDRIRESMVKRLKQEGIEDKVPQIVVPTETIADHRQGKKRIQRRKLYPGYLMVQMDLNDAVWFILRETPGFGDFVGAQAHPTPARAEDVEKAKQYRIRYLALQEGDRKLVIARATPALSGDLGKDFPAAALRPPTIAPPHLSRNEPSGL